MTHIHILGICGTFMGGLALLARDAGFRVTGSDQNIYPPMSDQLRESGIHLYEGYHPDNLKERPDQVIIGNALSRGNPEVEAVLRQHIPYDSGADWLKRHVLRDKWVLAVSGTHGKTSTASMLAWILEYAGMAPGFLIGGVPGNFGISARSGDTPFFVIEADEYDTAFFDKRSKFVHYLPKTLLINNIEFDHADIFDDMAAIQRQFHHLMRIVPDDGLVVYPKGEATIDEVMAMGCWSPTETIGGDWGYRLLVEDGSRFQVLCAGEEVGEVQWNSFGLHNVHNALGAIACARHAGVPVAHAIAALAEFQGIARRMQVCGVVNGVTVYDDFAHHPTAIATTVGGLRQRLGKDARIIAVLEPRSNTMKMGVHRHALVGALGDADVSLLYDDGHLGWKIAEVLPKDDARFQVFDTTAALIDAIVAMVADGDQVLVMSNGGFEGLHGRLLQRLSDSRVL
jgi:UDP-N-acetylmuramate: L-alanyl-gamma-D-glutamyl-meso-diaminopimelate ligase